MNLNKHELANNKHPMPSVFISYSHDSPEHRDCFLVLSIAVSSRKLEASGKVNRSDRMKIAPIFKSGKNEKQKSSPARDV
jgi:hypothetical protein